MSDLAARVLAIGARAKAAQPTRDENRAKYPEFAAWLAEVRATFPGCKLTRVDYLDTGKRWT